MAMMYGLRGAMRRPGGMISDSGFSDWDGGYSEWSPKRQRLVDWDGGYSEWSSKRQRLAEPNHYFPVSGSPSQFIAESCDFPLTDSGSMRARVGMDSYMTGPALNRYSHASGVLRGDSTASSKCFPVVQVRGLPFNCQDLDIYNFFAGLEVVDCLRVNQNGRFTGEAYVVFANPVHVQLALQRDSQSMGYRYVEVFTCKKNDYYNAVTAQVRSGGYISGCKQTPAPAPQNKWPHKIRKKEELPPVPQNKRPREEPKWEEMSPNGMRFAHELKLRGLPYSVTKADIVEFFGEEFDLKETDIDICYRYDGKPTGEVFAKFSSAEVAKKAMKRDMMTIGSRYVELFPSTAEDARCGNCWS